MTARGGPRVAVLQQCPESQDAMLAAHLSEIRPCPFYGMRVEYAPEAEGGAPQPALRMNEWPKRLPSMC